MVAKGTDGAAVRLARAGHGEHLVDWYDTDAALVEGVTAFAAPALSGDEAVALILTAAHGEQAEAALREDGFAVEELRAQGRLSIFDAAELAARLLVDGMPQFVRFREQVEEPIVQALAAYGGVRICGEMVALLWEAGNAPAVMELERLWNEHLRARQVALLCAYPMHAFAEEHTTTDFAQICDAHSVVVQGGGHPTPDEDKLARELVIMRREAVVGINARIALRQALHEQEAELRRLHALNRLRAQLVDVLAADTPSARRPGGPSNAVDALRKSACRQVRAVLGAKSCAFVADRTEDDRRPDVSGDRVMAPVSTGGEVHGFLAIELFDPPLDGDDMAFVQGAAETLAAALHACRRTPPPSTTP